MNTPKYLEIAELLRIDIFVKHAKENQLIPGIRSYAQIGLKKRDIKRR